jgi:hypothetical protein
MRRKEFGSSKSLQKNVQRKKPPPMRESGKGR